jgi:GH35 family endo-1,4-beta-xylanase
MSNESTLGETAEERGFSCGVAVDAESLRTDVGYRKTVSDFNALTPENALKMGSLRPSPDTYNFRDFSDRYTTHPLLFDEHNERKPTYYAVKDALSTEH